MEERSGRLSIRSRGKFSSRPVASSVAQSACSLPVFARLLNRAASGGYIDYGGLNRTKADFIFPFLFYFAHSLESR